MKNNFVKIPTPSNLKSTGNTIMQYHIIASNKTPMFSYLHFSAPTYFESIVHCRGSLITKLLVLSHVKVHDN